MERANSKEAFHSIYTSAQLNTNEQLSDLQMSQALSTFPMTFENPAECYQHHLFLRRRRASGMGIRTSTNEFWMSPALARYANSGVSGMVILKGAFTARSALQDFGIDVIQALSTHKTPTFWALPSIGKTPVGSAAAIDRTTSSLIKCLTYQALSMSGAAKTEKQMVMRCSQFQTAKTPKEWLDIFKQVVTTLRGPVYLVIDLAMACLSAEEAEEFNFIQELRDALGQFTAPKVKVILLLYEMDWFKLVPREVAGSVVTVKKARLKRPQSRAMGNAVRTGRSFPVCRARR